MALLESINAGFLGLGFVLGGVVTSIADPRAAIGAVLCSRAIRISMRDGEKDRETAVEALAPPLPEVARLTREPEPAGAVAGACGGPVGPARGAPSAAPVASRSGTLVASARHRPPQHRKRGPTPSASGRPPLTRRSNPPLTLKGDRNVAVHSRGLRSGNRGLQLP
jgi:hypothetical protein